MMWLVLFLNSRLLWFSFYASSPYASLAKKRKDHENHQYIIGGDYFVNDDFVLLVYIMLYIEKHLLNGFYEWVKLYADGTVFVYWCRWANKYQVIAAFVGLLFLKLIEILGDYEFYSCYSAVLFGSFPYFSM